MLNPRPFFLNLWKPESVGNSSWIPADSGFRRLPDLATATVAETSGCTGVGDRWNDVGNEETTQPAYLLEVDGSCTPRKAIAIPQLVSGFVVGATVTDGGCGYSNAPVVLIQGGGGMGATAQATVADGRVVSIRIISAGCCYTNAPTINVASPPFVPTLSISVSEVRVTQKVVLGWKYVLETSTDNRTWTATGPPFIAESEIITSEFDVEGAGSFFRLRVVP